MTIEHDVAAATNPKEAMLVIARALDTLTALAVVTQREAPPDLWGTWSEAPITSADIKAIDDRRAAVEIIQDADTTDIVIPPPSPEKLEARRQFAVSHLKLHEHLPPTGLVSSWADVYAKGGPLWLYHGNRELFMTFSDSARAAMVADVLEDDPKAAHEMGRDVLKEPCNEYDPNSSANRIDEGVAPVRGDST